MAFLLRFGLMSSIVLVLALGACGEPLPSAQDDEPRFRSGPGPLPARYVGVLPWPFPWVLPYPFPPPPASHPAPLAPGVCVGESSWIGEPLFSGDVRSAMSLLDRYCVYTWMGGGVPAGFSASFVNRHVRLDPDPNIVVPQTTPNQVRAERTLQALGATLASSNPPLGWSDSDVYVAIVDNEDSTAIGPPTQSTQLHGSAMRQLIETVRCPFGSSSPQCAHRQFFKQAFPYAGDDPRPSSSRGELGSLGSLATAIADSVSEWRDPSTPGDEDWHLVINMSLGWDPAFRASPWRSEPGEPSESSGTTETGATQTGFEPGTTDTGSESGVTETDTDSDGPPPHSLPGQMLPSPAPYDLPVGFDATQMLAGSDAATPAPVQAVYAALAWAACEGALSIAASGNDIRPRCEQQGPLAPASWEVHSTSAEVCEVFDIVRPLEDDGPIVYAVGGLDAADRPIANARLGSMPRRALYATQVNVLGGSPEPLTGTSLSAAALSAIAAQLWSQQPDESSVEIMERLDASGEALELAVEWGDYENGPVHRIDAHAALVAPGIANPFAPRSSATTVGPSGGLDAAIDGMLTSTSYAPTLPWGGPTQPSTQNPECAPATMTIYGNAGPLMPPEPHADETRPQPTVPICPKCPIRQTLVPGTVPSSQWIFYLDLAPTTAFIGATVYPLLTFQNDTNTGQIEIQLDTIPNYQGPLKIVLPNALVSSWLPPNSGITTGLLELKVVVPGSTSWYVGVVDVVP
jgi:hypothetical protein